ncbi:hypothetical protein J6590_018543 [Homalodisca vitripennis]|nr:hypothetical protein J6590_018543 [Homalodisca vitripennis]
MDELEMIAKILKITLVFPRHKDEERPQARIERSVTSIRWRATRKLLKRFKWVGLGRQTQAGERWVGSRP